MGLKFNSYHFYGTNGAKRSLLPFNIQLFASKPKDKSQQKHIARETIGHLPDTSTTWAILEKVSSNEKNFVGIDRFGNRWYSYILSTGKQIWVKTRNNIIQDGGKNDSFRPMTVDGIKSKTIILRSKKK